MVRRHRRALCVSVLAVCILAVYGCGANSSAGGSSAASAGPTPGAGCKPKHSFSTHTKGEILVAGAYDGIHLSQNADGTLGGLDGVILNKIAQLECARIVATNVPAAGALTAVSSGRADLAAGGWVKSPERAKQLGQTTDTYYDIAGVVSKSGFNTLDQLRGKTVTITQGYLYVAPLQQVLGASHVNTFQTSQGAVQDIVSGRADATVLGYPEAAYLAKKVGHGLQAKPLVVKPDTPKPLAIVLADNLPHTPGNPAFAKALDEDITTLRQDGTIRAALERLGVTEAVAFTGQR